GSGHRPRPVLLPARRIVQARNLRRQAPWPLSISAGVLRRGGQGAGTTRAHTARRATMIPKNTICLWYDRDALEAARFYAATFPDTVVGPVHRAPGDYPDGKQGDVLTVEFTVMGIPCIGLNGGPAFKHDE